MEARSQLRHRPTFEDDAQIRTSYVFSRSRIR
jgi:hypothetical protein